MPSRLAAALLAVLLAAPADAGESPSSRFEYSQPHMGTTARVVVFAGDRTRADAAAAAAFARVAELDAVMSDYRPASELMRLSNEAVRRARRVGPDLFRVLELGQALAARSGGAFDVTAGPLTRVWRRARRLAEAPEPDQLETARARTGFQHLELDPERRTVRLAREGMQLDLGGIAKGYAADAALAVMVAHGLPHALISIGGDVAAGAPPPGSAGWEVAVVGLDPARPPAARLSVSHAGVSTSGDAEQWVQISGRRLSHILDPRTGRPREGRRSVTVVAPDATTSDMLATAVTVMGPADGVRLVDGTPGAAAFVIVADGGVTHEHRSSRWTARLTRPNPD